MKGIRNQSNDGGSLDVGSIHDAKNIGDTQNGGRGKGRCEIGVDNREQKRRLSL